MAVYSYYWEKTVAAGNYLVAPADEEEEEEEVATEEEAVEEVPKAEQMGTIGVSDNCLEGIEVPDPDSHFWAGLEVVDSPWEVPVELGNCI